MTQTHSRAPKIEFRIPISANDKFLRMTQYFLESIQLFGGPLAKAAHCVVSVSRDEPFRDLYRECPWTEHYSVEFRWLDPELFKNHGYDGTGFDRYHVESDADIIILADADILIAGNFDDIVWRSFNEKKELGFIAHVSPFNDPEFKDTSSVIWWEKLYEQSKLTPVNLNHEHTAFGFMGSLNNSEHQKCPYYFNYGFIVTLNEYVKKIGTTFEEELLNVDKVLDTWFKSQIANTLSYTRHKIPCDTLSLNYNFPLHISEDRIRKANPDKDGKNDPEDIKVFHYLGNGDFNKEDFATDESLQDALNREVVGSRRVFRDKLQIIYESIQSK